MMRIGVVTYPIRRAPLADRYGGGVAHIVCQVDTELIDLLNRIQFKLRTDQLTDLVRWMVQNITPAIEA